MTRIPWPSLNLWRVSPSFYRGAQFDLSDLSNLKVVLGLTAVLDLRETGEHDAAAEETACKAVGLAYLAVPMDDVEPPTQEQIAAALAFLALDGAVVLVHCLHGEDRTGIVCACYELVQGISMETALHDFYRGHTRGIWGEYWMFHSVWEFSVSKIVSIKAFQPL